MRQASPMILVSLLCLAGGGCLSTYTVGPGTVEPVKPGGLARAGAAAVDITPAMGLPLFGYSFGGAKAARGYWSRLSARVLVLDDGTGERVALVQLDLGASSDLLRHLVAARTAAVGIGPANLLLFASHTHAGPGGYFGDAVYNLVGSGKPGFFEDLVEWQADRIAGAVEDAVRALQPAKVAVRVDEIDGLSRNRSLQAWRRNFEPYDSPYPFGIRPRLILLRVDSAAGHSEPIAALSLFPLHNTAAGPDTDLYHGDLQGIASAVLRRRVESASGGGGSPGFVVLVGSPAQGDVSASWSRQSFDEVVQLGTRLGDEAYDLWKSIAPGGMSSRFDLDVRYTEATLPRAGVGGETTLCGRARFGAAMAGGADDGRYSAFLGQGYFGHVEGSPRLLPRGCHTYKRSALGVLQSLLPRSIFPRTVPLHRVRIGDHLVLAGVGGEPTTEVGRKIEAAVSCSLVGRGDPIVVTLSHVDTYTSYVTTRAEYEAQHYEGGSTLYGPATADFWISRLGDRPARADGGSPGSTRAREFRVGPKKRYIPRRGRCDPKRWQWSPVGTGTTWTLDWTAERDTDWCAPPPIVRVECGNGSGAWATVADDDGNGVTVRRLGEPGRWRAVWTPKRGHGECRFRVTHAGAEIHRSGVRSCP